MKTYNFEDVRNIRRDYYGVVVEIIYKNRTWNKKFLRLWLQTDAEVQRAALKVILHQHSLMKEELRNSDEPELYAKNLKYMKGIHPRHVKLVSSLEYIVCKPKLNEAEVSDIGKFLPKYAEQIWIHMLGNLNIKYKAQTFSTPRRSSVR